jgi:single-strand DNA-binding protein
MVNKIILIGNVGNDPEVKTMQSGDKVCNLTLATSESWKDKSSGERKTKTEWHKVVIFNQPLIKVCEDYVKKGSKLYVEGQLETRSWEKDGTKHYSTEVVLKPFRGEISLLDGKKEEPQEKRSGFIQGTTERYRTIKDAQAPIEEFEDDLPWE